MKKIIILGLILLSLGWSRVENNSYIDDLYKFRIDAKDSWTIDDSHSKKRVVFQNKDQVSEIEVDVMVMSADQNNAEDIAKFQIETYDGWQYHGSRKAEGYEMNRAGAKDGYVGVYSKRILSNAGGVKTIIVTERYFVKDRYAYIISGITDNKNWENVKNEIIDMMNSFRFL